jgi:hypothetical protein
MSEKLATVISSSEDGGKKVAATSITLADIEALGLTKAAENIRREVAIGDNPELKRKLRTAFEFFRVVEPEKLKAFNERLKAKTIAKFTRMLQHSNKEVIVRVYNQLHFCQIGEYPTLPPEDVLLKLKEAVGRNCFDHFVIATLQQTEEHTPVPVPVYKDPILFGMIKESPNLYFIAQWDDDVKIEDILQEDEG